MSEHHVSKLTQRFEECLDAFERLDTYVLDTSMNDEEDATDSKILVHLQQVLENVLAKRAYLTSEDLARMFRLFTQALK